MITLSWEAFAFIISVCCGAGYILGKDIHEKK